MNKENFKKHTRNQRRMYRIHKMEEKIEEQNLIIGSLINSLNKKVEEGINLTQRIDKAVEYNQEIIDNYLKEDDCEYCDGRYSVAKKNINILKGDDTNENN